MSHISKALDKYKKERNLSSAQIFNLDDAKATEPALKEGEDRSARKGVDADAAKQPAQPSPPQTESIDSKEAASRETVQQQAERPDVEDAVSEADRKPHFGLADKQPEKTVSTAVENKEKGALGEEQVAGSASKQPKYIAVVPSEPVATEINLDKIDPNLVSVVNPESLETEIFKVLRGKILFPASGKPPRSIMVTSAVPGEGKSFVAANLAVNMAQNIEDHVLLMDCDLRRPTMHRLFGLGRVKGLSEHLANGNKIPDLLIKTGLGKLSLFPSGTPPHNPSEVLSSAKMANLLEELKTRYQDRYLIIESPPPMLAPETSAIAKQVDAIIVVIKFGSTPMDAVEELIDNLGKEKIIGAVINRFDARTSRYYGYRKYGKYYRSKP
jgi:exopolysaccharide/PEP-CTERM locus tyrosine autokinase